MTKIPTVPRMEPGGVVRVFHLTAVTKDRDEAVDRLVTTLGAVTLHSEEGDTFGVSMRRTMLWLGDNLLEIIEPVGPSAFDTFLTRFGGGLHSIGLQVDNLGATKARLERAGAEIAIEYDQETFATRTSSSAGLALQWTTAWVPDDPRRNPRQGDADNGHSDALRLAFVAALVNNPSADAIRLGELVGSPVKHFDPPGTHGPHAGVGIGDCQMLFYPVSESEATWGRRYERSRLIALGIQVSHRSRTLLSLASSGAKEICRHGDNIHFDIGAGHPTIVLCEPFNPDDPRNH